ncbi:acetyltransferase [Lysobacter sp. TY2-98]|uniref:acetyltransferase n=1 Tax=Lysobacter sp. TY2-98 TaxID=2290922 RepID=UPI000E1FDC49|nr:acetyltransferase [Lysobacter sp. TY2-98]AXK73746.1 acetyltransferase [Lysobacter sp. TY2-98]
MTLFGIMGAGGFAREVMPVADEMLAQGFDKYELVFVTTAGSADRINGKLVISEAEFLNHPGDKRYSCAIADSALRRKIDTQMTAAEVRPFTIAAVDHLSLTHNDIGEGAILCPFTTVTANARIGRHFHANLYSYVAHDCEIGHFVTFAPNVHCNGRVVIEDDVYVGAGAMIRHGSEDAPLVIGRGAVIGMGAVVTRSVAAGETVVGNPAAPIRRR